jgi:heme exporter protein CcmD
MSSLSSIPHIEMIVAAYAVAAIAIAAMIGFVLIDYRSLRAELAALERKSGDREGRP